MRSSAASITLDSIDLLILSGEDLVVKNAARSVRAFVARGGGVIMGADVRRAMLPTLHLSGWIRNHIASFTFSLPHPTPSPSTSTSTPSRSSRGPMSPLQNSILRTSCWDQWGSTLLAGLCILRLKDFTSVISKSPSLHCN